jgi:hypothetical protein
MRYATIMPQNLTFLAGLGTWFGTTFWYRARVLVLFGTVTHTVQTDMV